MDNMEILKMTTQGQERPTFDVLVKRLFKIMPGYGAAMMHAAIGIAGETGELRSATDIQNLHEELGDIEFYIEAAWQQMATMKRGDVIGVELEEYPLHYGDLLDNIHVCSSEILGHAKKVWVHEDGNKDVLISRGLCALEVNLRKIYKFHGLEQQAIREMNITKLLKRYATGTYSNEAAIAKVDKVGTGRKFMSDKGQE